MEAEKSWRRRRRVGERAESEKNVNDNRVGSVPAGRDQRNRTERREERGERREERGKMGERGEKKREDNMNGGRREIDNAGRKVTNLLLPACTPAPSYDMYLLSTSRVQRALYGGSNGMIRYPVGGLEYKCPRSFRGDRRPDQWATPAPSPLSLSSLPLRSAQA